MPPGSSRRAVLADANDIPRSRSEVGMLRYVFSTFQNARSQITLWEIGHGIAARLEQHESVFAVGNPGSTEPHAHAPAQWLDVQQSFRQRFGHEEPTDCSG